MDIEPITPMLALVTLTTSGIVETEIYKMLFGKEAS